MPLPSTPRVSMIETPATSPTARASASPDGALRSERLRLQIQNAFADCYRIGQLIGRGQCSATFRATRVDSGDPVALKVLDFDAASDPELVAHVMSECSLPQTLVDTCALVPRRQEQRGSLVVFVMPYMPGGSVGTLLGASAPPPMSRVQEIISGVAISLECLHRQGATHLGLTPENILLDSHGRPSITDVGITSAMLKAPRVHGTRSSRASAYAAPEQRRTQKVDGRADQYALAVIAYELLTGHRRLEEETVQGIYTIAPIEIPTDVPLRPGHPLFINMALRRALSAGPENRFSSVTEFADALAGRARESGQGLPTAHVRFRIDRRRRIARTFGALIMVCALVIIASPSVRVAIRTTWRWGNQSLGWARPISVSVDPSAVSAPSAASRASGAGTAPTSNSAVAAPRPRSGGSQSAVPLNKTQTVAEGPSEATASTPVDVRLGSSTPQGAVLPGLPSGSSAASGGMSIWRSTRSWIERKFGPSPAPITSSSATAYIHVSVDRGMTLVSVDGIPRGSAPTNISVEPGHHTVAVTGALAYSDSPAGVNASAGDTVSVSFHGTAGP